MATNLRPCWIGGTRYTHPLNPTNDAKWSALASIGVPLTVIGFSTGVRPRHFTQGATFYLLPKVAGATLRHATMYSAGFLLALWVTWRRGVNVIIAQGPYEGALGAAVKRVAGWFGREVTLVVESHGNFELAVFVYREVRLRTVYRALMNRAARFALSNADVLRPVSNSTREQLQQYAPDVPVVQFMAWINAATFANTKRDAPPSASKTLVFAGGLAPVKGVHFLLDAFAQVLKRHPEARLELVGRPQNPDYAAQLQAQAQSLNLPDAVDFIGGVEQDDLARRLSRARALVLPSISEGMPRIIAEAFLCGLPVVASAVGGIPDVVRDGDTGFLAPPGDVDALAAALLRVMDADVDAMGAKAQAFADEHFGANAFVDGHRRLFALVAGT